MKPSSTMILLPALLLAACSSKEVPADNTAITIKSLNGTVIEGEFIAENGKAILKTKGWTGGEGETLFNIVNSGKSPSVVARAALSADGNWSFADLPVPKLDSTDKITNYNEICPNNFVVSDPEALSIVGFISVSSKKNGFIELINSDGVNVKTWELVYVDRAVTVKGKQSCKTENGIDTGDFDLNLAVGWNITTTTRKNGDKTFTVRNGSPTSAQWVYFKGLFTR